MDPKANIEEQREIAQRIVARPQTIASHRDGEKTYSVVDSAARLAELVLALDEWRDKGGFDLYDVTERGGVRIINEHGPGPTIVMPGAPEVSDKPTGTSGRAFS